jgi:hypothetical protein
VLHDVDDLRQQVGDGLYVPTNRWKRVVDDLERLCRLAAEAPPEGNGGDGLVDSAA